LETVMRNPYFLSLLIADGANIDSNIRTEVEIANVWWRRRIGGGGASGLSRQQTLLKIGDLLWSGNHSEFPITTLDPSALHSLESDVVVVPLEGRDQRHFSHDILLDWVLCRCLDQHRSELPKLLLESGQPLPFVRAIQLFSMSLLEVDKDPALWKTIYDQLNATKTLAGRWAQSFLLGPVVSFKGSDLLKLIGPVLLGGNAATLADMIRCMMVLQVEPELLYLSAALSLGQSIDEIVQLMWSDPIPVTGAWMAFFSWIFTVIDDVPTSLRGDLLTLFECWQRKTSPGTPYRDKVAETCVDWLDKATTRISV